MRSFLIAQCKRSDKMDLIFEDKIEMLKSNKGGAKLLFRGYMYTVHKRVQGRIRWRCSQRSLSCKGSVSTGLGPPIINLAHNHVPDMHAVARARCRSHLLEQEALAESAAYSANSSFVSQSSLDMPLVREPHDLLQVEHSDTDNEVSESSPGSKSPTKPVETEKSSPSKPSISKPSTEPTEPESEMCLRWNSHHFNMSTVIPALMNDERYVDVTLMCEGKLIKCHKLILSSCSDYFDEMLKNTVSNMQTVIFLRNIKYWQMKALLDFMYKGEVNIDQTNLEPLLKAAEDLKIKGLARKQSSPEPEEDKKPVVISPSQPPPPPPPVDRPEKIKTEEKYEDYVDHAMMDDDEEYFPYAAYKKKLKKNRKRKINSPPDPSLLKHVKINLKGTKSRPNIKQPKFYSPDYPEYDPDRSVSPPKLESNPAFQIDNIKLEPIDIEVPQSPIFFEMKSMMDKSTPELKDKPKIPKNIKVYSKQKHHVTGDENQEEKCKIDSPQPSTSKENIEKPSTDATEAATIDKITNKEVLSLNKKAIILKCQNVKQLINENSSIQKILDAATTKQTLSDSDKSKLPQIRVRNLPTTETVLKKFATTQLTSILKKEGPVTPNKHIILTKVPGTKPTILKHPLPEITNEFTTEIRETNEGEIAEKISLLAKTKKELSGGQTAEIIESDETKAEKKTIIATSPNAEKTSS